MVTTFTRVIEESQWAESLKQINYLHLAEGAGMLVCEGVLNNPTIKSGLMLDYENIWIEGKGYSFRVAIKQYNATLPNVDPNQIVRAESISHLMSPPEAIHVKTRNTPVYQQLISDLFPSLNERGYRPDVVDGVSIYAEKHCERSPVVTLKETHIGSIRLDITLSDIASIGPWKLRKNIDALLSTLDTLKS